MATVTYNLRINPDTRKQAEAVLKSMGMSISTAVSILLEQVIKQRKFPITEIVADPIYADALLRDAADVDAAIADGTANVYRTPDELFASWEGEHG